MEESVRKNSSDAILSSIAKMKRIKNRLSIIDDTERK